MARVKLVVFDGLYPSVPPRSLKDDAAQTCTDLLATARHFKPLGGDDTVVAISGVTNPKSIYRFPRVEGGAFNTTMTTGWVVNAAHVNYAPAPVEGTTSRTYYTRGDGAAAPRAMDNTGEDRLLGVPTPEEAPGLVVNVVDEFTPEDRGSALETAKQTAIAAIRNRVTPVWRGATSPGTGTAGYIDATAANGFAVPNPSMQARVYRLNGAGDAISDSYTSLDDSLFAWVFDPRLSGFQGQAIASSPGWAGGTGTYHYGITYSAYALTFDIDAGNLSDDLEAIPMPGTTDGTKLFTPEQATEIVDELEEYAAYDGDQVGPMLDALKAKVAELHTILDGGAASSLANQREAFYSKTDVAASIAQWKTNFANATYDVAASIVRSSLPADYFTSPDGGV